METSIILNEWLEPKTPEWKLELKCSVCGNSEWVVVADVERHKLRALSSFYFICPKHVTTRPV